MADSHSNPIQVAVGVIRQADQVLLSKRPVTAHQGGLWEFPGGKCESGETTSEALARELQEELGIIPQQHRPLIRITHHYPDRSVVLDVHLISSWQGKPQGLENQPIKWVSINNLTAYPMPAADKPIVDAIKLPDSYAITPAQIDNPTTFLQDLAHQLNNGLQLLQFRVFGLADQQYTALLSQVHEHCVAANAQLMLNNQAELAWKMGIDGLHLNSRQLLNCQKRPKDFTWVAASCHSQQDLQHAQKIGADFAVLSPVMATRSHPDAEPLGWEQFTQMVDSATIPVYALGGMHQNLIPKSWTSGAQGIAGIRGFWSYD